MVCEPGFCRPHGTTIDRRSLFFDSEGQQDGIQAGRTDRGNLAGGPAGRARTHRTKCADPQHGPGHRRLHHHLARVLWTMKSRIETTPPHSRNSRSACLRGGLGRHNRALAAGAAGRPSATRGRRRSAEHARHGSSETRRNRNRAARARPILLPSPRIRTPRRKSKARKPRCRSRPPKRLRHPSRTSNSRRGRLILLPAGWPFLRRRIDSEENPTVMTRALVLCARRLPFRDLLPGRVNLSERAQGRPLVRPCRNGRADGLGRCDRWEHDDRRRGIELDLLRPFVLGPDPQDRLVDRRPVARHRQGSLPVPVRGK